MRNAVSGSLQEFLKTSKAGGNPDLAYGLEDETLRTATFYEYPARMVSKLQGDLLDALLRAEPSARLVADPFMGSGTVMVEAMSRGMDFIGQDINPLSLLLCQVQAGPFHPSAVDTHVATAIENIQSDRGSSIDVKFRGRSKWYGTKALRDLSRIRRGIMDVHVKWARRFLWVALAETARLASNSRPSTYKLHIRSADDLSTRQVDALGLFQDIAARNANRYKQRAAELQSKGYLRNGRYDGRIHLRCADSRNGLGVAAEGSVDVLMTSPPYGDNRTTVTYGQHSYLPLHWIDWGDIHAGIDPTINETAYRLDSASLGGIWRGDSEEESVLRARSPAADAVLSKLERQPPDRKRRVLTFVHDLYSSIEALDPAIKPGGHSFWTLGSRTVGGHRVPIDKLVEELAAKHERIITIKRRIPRKRMANRNAITETMQQESILVLRKPRR